MPKTYNDIYFKLRTKLRDNGVEAFGLEARILLAAAAGKTVEELLRDLNLYTSSEIEEKATSMLDRRLTGEPLAYIAGEWEFHGLPMIVTPDVLIPRMDTEVLVDAAVDALKHYGRRGRVLDLCCGSGCIACAIGAELPTVRIVAADNSPAALEVSRRNISLNKQLPRIITMLADAKTWPPMGIGSFDLIVSNPPYIATSEILTLDSSVRDYEPLCALDGGNDGLDFYRAIIKYWTITLRPNGLMMFEVGEEQAEAIKQMLLSAGYVSAISLPDTAGTLRVVVGKWKNEY